MPPLIKFKRGTEATAPVLASGEPGWATDTGRLLVGTGSANVVIGPFSTISAENKTGADVDAGTVVAAHSSGTGFALADLSGSGADAVGLAVADIADSVSGVIQTGGILSLPDWTAATGSSSLTALSPYFADPSNPGMLTTTPPTSTGHRLQYVGRAVSPQSLWIEIDPPILL